MLPLTLLVNGHTDSVNCLSLSDQLLASGGDDGNICLWSPNEAPRRVSEIVGNGICSAVKFHPSDCNILYSAHDRDICTWDIRQLGCPLTEWNVNTDEINSIDVLDGEPRLASADDSGVVHVVDTSTGSLVRTLKKHDNVCSVVRFRPNRNWQLITGGLDCRMVVSDWKCSGLGVIIFELSEIVPSAFFSAIHSSAMYVYPPNLQSAPRSTESHASSGENDVVGDDGDDFEEDDRDSVELSDLHEESGELLEDPMEDFVSRGSPDERSSEMQTPASTPAFIDSFGNPFPINPPMVQSMACSPSGDKVVAGLERCTVEFFEGTGKRLNHIKSLVGHHRAVSALHFIGETTVLSGGIDKNVFIWQLDTDRVCHSLTHDSKINVIEGRDLSRIFLGDCTSTIQVYDLSIG